MVLYGSYITKRIETVVFSPKRGFKAQWRLYSYLGRLAYKIKYRRFLIGKKYDAMISDMYFMKKHPEELVIILRGESFRENNNFLQQLSVISHVEMLVVPIRTRFPYTKLKFVLATYPDARNNKIKKLLSIYGPVDQITLDVNKDNQLTTFEKIITYIARSGATGGLCSRFDLVITQKLSRLDFANDVLSFPWAYPENQNSRKIADQIHFIGRDIARNLELGLDLETLEGEHPGTLHNLYNYAKILGLQDISFNYLFNIPPPKFDKRGDNQISGNPMKRLGNPSFFYTRDWPRLGLDQYSTNKIYALNRMVMNLESSW